MIIEWFAEMVGGLLGAIADWLPEFTMPAAPTGALAFAYSVDAVFPVTELVQIGVLWLAFLALLFVYRVIKILVGHVPAFGGGGA